jgi:hypothetical protein
MRAAPDIWLMILPYSSSIVSCTTERITHRGGPSLKVIALSDNYRERISKLRIFSFHLWVSCLRGNTPVVSTNGVGRLLCGLSIRMHGVRVSVSLRSQSLVPYGARVLPPLRPAAPGLFLPAGEPLAKVGRRRR